MYFIKCNRIKETGKTNTRAINLYSLAEDANFSFRFCLYFASVTPSQIQHLVQFGCEHFNEEEQDKKEKKKKKRRIEQKEKRKRKKRRGRKENRGEGKMKLEGRTGRKKKRKKNGGSRRRTGRERKIRNSGHLVKVVQGKQLSKRTRLWKKFRNVSKKSQFLFSP